MIQYTWYKIIAWKFEWLQIKYKMIRYIKKEITEKYSGMIFF